MPQLILIRHAQSVADVVVEEMHRDPLYKIFQKVVGYGLPTKLMEAIARELHYRYRLPCDINHAKLTEQGIRSITALGRFLKTMKVKARNVWCSPLTRTRDTLKYLTSYCPHLREVTTVLDERIIERQRGNEAAEFANIQLYINANRNELLRKRRCIPLGYAPPGGESLRDVRTRTALALQEILAQLHNGDALVVTHHTVINSLRGHLEKWSENELLANLVGNKTPNCGALVYDSASESVSLVTRSW